MVLSAAKPAGFAAIPADAPPEALYVRWPVAGDKDNWMSILLAAAPAQQTRVWVDTDRNSRFDPAESFAFGDLQWQGGTVRGAEFKLPLRPGTPERTMRIWLGTMPNTLGIALRGYCAGTVQLGDKAVPALLMDADFSGTFDTVGRDLLYTDLDGNGRYFVPTERTTLAEKVRLGDRTYRLKIEPGGADVIAQEIYGGSGSLKVTCCGKVATGLSLLLRRDDGVLANVPASGQAVPLAEGEWLMQNLSPLKLSGNKVEWVYTLRPGGAAPTKLTVRAGQQTAYELVGRLTAKLEGAPQQARRGQRLGLSAVLQTTGGLSYGGASRLGGVYGATSVPIRVLLQDSAGKQRAEAGMQFG